MLKSWVILEPKWGTDAVYRVLDDRQVANERGRFGPGDLARIWAEGEYAPMRDELLRLMMRFQLCYGLPEGTAYIAPQRLSSDQPEYEIGDKDGLGLRYGYDFMPTGMITRFIVAMHHLIAGQRLVWKTGVVLEREGTRAEVIEDYPQRRILVRVAGGDTRGLLAIVNDQLERIHRSFPRLRYEKFLPCHCPACAGENEPYLFPLEELRDFARTGDRIQGRISRKLVDAAALIRDVMPSALREDDRLVTAGGFSELPASAMQEAEPVKEVFVSYAWKSAESVQIVDQLEEFFQDREIRLIRDKSELTFKDPIRAFMRRLGDGKSIVLVLSTAYL